MFSSVIIGAILELIGSIIMIYNLAQGFNENWPWAAMGAAVMIAGLIILYAGFRPVVM